MRQKTFLPGPFKHYSRYEYNLLPFFKNYIGTFVPKIKKEQDFYSPVPYH